jgi:uncharacterized integral membrane protein
MNSRTLFLILVLLAIGAFAVLNWAAFTAPTTLALGFADVQAPLGLVMMAVVVLLTAIFLLYILYIQTTVLLDARRSAKEVRAHRELADKAEASRFTELRSFLDSEMKRQTEINAQAHAAVMAKFEQLDHDIRQAVEQSGNSLSACIGELDDRIERGGPDHTPRLPG